MTRLAPLPPAPQRHVCATCGALHPGAVCDLCAIRRAIASRQRAAHTTRYPIQGFTAYRTGGIVRWAALT